MIPMLEAQRDKLRETTSSAHFSYLIVGLKEYVIAVGIINEAILITGGHFVGVSFIFCLSSNQNNSWLSF